MTFVFQHDNTVWIQGSPYTPEALSSLAETEDAARVYKAALKDPTNHLVDIRDIKAFAAKSGERKDNDRLNACRERMLAASQHVPPAFFEDATHGPSWKAVMTEWRGCLDRLLVASYSGATEGAVSEATEDAVSDRSDETHPVIAWMGGRKYKYDFDVTFRRVRDGATLCRAAVEFKHNTKSLYGLTQFLSIPAKPGVFMGGVGVPGYAEFFYDRFLPAYLACDAGAPVLPERSLYLQHVYKSDPTCHPFFTALMAREETAKATKAAKTAVVHASIAAYLEEHVGNFDVTAFVQQIRDTQKDKHFALWKPGSVGGTGGSNGTFVLESLMMPDAVWSSATLGSPGIKGRNTVVVELPGDPQKRAFHALLRWRNHLGILNPAWQIKVVSGLIRVVRKTHRR